MPRASLLAALVLAAGTPALAQDDVLTMAMRSPSPAELSAVEPLLGSAVVMHIETTELVELPQVTVVARAEVGCDVVLGVLRDVASYPTFMPAIDTVETTTGIGTETETDDASAYHWTWQASVLSFRGSSTVSILPSEEGTEFRAVLTTLDGDLGRARRVLRATPIDAGACRLVLTARQDVRDSNYITREAAPSAPTLSRTLDIVISVATVARLRGEAERRAGHVRPPIVEPLGDPRTLAVDVGTLRPWIDRGETFVLETTDGSDLGAIVGLSSLAFPVERVRSAFFDPVRFCVGLLAGAYITELERAERTARYGWSVDVPFLGSSGEMTIRDVDADEVELEATAGAMRGGRVVLTTHPSEIGTIASLAARLDPSDGVPIVAAIESTDPAFRPGLVASGLLMAFRGLRRGLTEGH